MPLPDVLPFMVNDPVVTRDPGILLRNKEVMEKGEGRASLAGEDYFDVALAVTNPNSFDLTIVRYSYALSVMGLPLGTGQNEKAITFPANKQNTIHLPVRVTHRHLLSAITRLPDPDRVPYHLKAELTFATPFGEKMVPLDRHGHFPLPERYRPKAILKGILERIAP